MLEDRWSSNILLHMDMLHHIRVIFCRVVRGEDAGLEREARGDCGDERRRR
jgi:hypothetical protein